MWLGDKFGERDLDVLFAIPDHQAEQWIAYFQEKASRELIATKAAKKKAELEAEKNRLAKKQRL